MYSLMLLFNYLFIDLSIYTIRYLGISTRAFLLFQFAFSEGAAARGRHSWLELQVENGASFFRVPG